MVEMLELPQSVWINDHALAEMPILILNVHDSCNCRCLMCDIWKRDSATSLTRQDVERHRRSLRELKVRDVVLTGGEPLLNGDFAGICSFLQTEGVRVTLLTTGLLLNKRAIEVAAHVDEVILSLDGPQEIHDSIRQVSGAFAIIRSGIARLKALRPELRITARCTIQRSNHAALIQTVEAARSLGLDAISFLAVDVSSTAFNRPLVWPVERQSEIALSVKETAELEGEIERLIELQAHTLPEKFIVEKPEKLRRIVRMFRSYHGQSAADAPLCNAPWVSAVVEVDGSVRPCFFHPPLGDLREGELVSILQGNEARRFRKSLEVSANPICQRCVCSLNYRP